MVIVDHGQENVRMKHPQKRVNVSSQRQITLPKEFFDEMGIGKELLVEFVGNRLVLRPVKEEEDFSVEILNELVAEGFSGEELVAEFTARKAQLEPALQRYLEEERPKAREISDVELFGEDEHE